MTSFKGTVDFKDFTAVDIVEAPTAVPIPTKNNILLFTNENPSQTEAPFPFVVNAYSDSETVARHFGTDSITYAMANSIFSQSIGINLGRGTLIIASTQATSETTAVVKFTDFFVKPIATWQALVGTGSTSGTVKFTVNGTDVILQDLDFSSVLSMTDVHKILIDAYLSSPDVTTNNLDVYSYQEGNDLIISSGLKGTGSIVVANSGETGVELLSSSDLLQNNTATPAVSFTGEKLDDAINRLSQSPDFQDLKIYDFGIVLSTVQYGSTALKGSILDFFADKDYIFFDFVSTITEIEDIAKYAFDANNENVHFVHRGFLQDRLIDIKLINTEPFKMKSSIASFLASTNVNFLGATFYVPTAKQLDNLSPDESLNDNIKTACDTNGVDYYGTLIGANVYKQNVDKNGNVIGQVLFKYKLALELNVANLNVLRTTSAIIANDTNKSKIRNATSTVLDKFRDANYITAQTPTTNIPSGVINPTAFINDITTRGYHILINFTQNAQGQNIADVLVYIQQSTVIVKIETTVNLFR